MTHDELLARIDREIATFTLASIDDANLPDLQAWQALKAVVKIHKPLSEKEHAFYPNISDEMKSMGFTGAYCSGCKTDLYPCPTIQAIEKELG